MGYTHYFSRVAGNKKNAAKLEKQYKLAIEQCQKIVKFYSDTYGGLSGYTAHTLPGKYGGLNVNGSGDNGHEDFVMREHWSENGGEFCKTARKPYDVVVVACLIVLKHYMGDDFKVGSDGFAQDWLAGLGLAQHITELKNLRVPSTIVPMVSDRVALRLLK